MTGHTWEYVFGGAHSTRNLKRMQPFTGLRRPAAYLYINNFSVISSDAAVADSLGILLDSIDRSQGGV